MPDFVLTLCAVLRVPSDGLAAFQAYEDAVLPLLADHGGSLRRRLRTADGLTEIHLIQFPSAVALDAFRADPRRAAQAPLFEASGATAEMWIVEDVDPLGVSRPC
jgi:hypothetical protein